MTPLLPDWPLLAAFLVASFVLAVTPGPGILYIVTRSVVQGRRSGLASVAGVALGNLCNAVAASVGLAALLAVSSLAFTILKYAGAAYLIYLGVQALRTPAPPAAVEAAPTPLATGRVFRDGFFVALLNPKTAVFFAAFLPQFIHAQTASILQSIVLGSMFVSIAAITDSTYALAASAIAPMLGNARSTRALGRYLSGGVYLGLGVLTLLADSQQQ